jgi:hypothetical protein
MLYAQSIDSPCTTMMQLFKHSRQYRVQLPNYGTKKQKDKQ